MKIVFFGTNHFSWLILENLLNDSTHEVVGVVTSFADEKSLKKNTYNHKVLVKLKEIGFPEGKIFTPKKASSEESVEQLKQLNADLFIVASYGQILKKNLLDVPRYFCLNIHPSLLPKWRGASPVQWTILHGEVGTGITFIKMTPGMDDGPIVFQKKYILEKGWTSLDALDFLGKESAKCLIDVLEKIKSNVEKIHESSLHNETFTYEQDHSKATFCPLIKKSEGQINIGSVKKGFKPFSTAEKIINKFKAFQPWPGVFFRWNGKRVKLIEIDFQPKSVQGNLLFKNEGNLYLQTIDASIQILKIQVEGKNVITSDEFIRGYLNK